MMLNLIVDSAFTYGLVYYLQKFGIASLVRMKKIQLMYVFTIEALLLYGFQFVNEKNIIERIESISDNSSFHEWGLYFNNNLQQSGARDKFCYKRFTA